MMVAAAEATEGAGDEKDMATLSSASVSAGDNSMGEGDGVDGSGDNESGDGVGERDVASMLTIRVAAASADA